MLLNRSSIRGNCVRNTFINGQEKARYERISRFFTFTDRVEESVNGAKNLRIYALCASRDCSRISINVSPGAMLLES